MRRLGQAVLCILLLSLLYLGCGQGVEEFREAGLDDETATSLAASAVPSEVIPPPDNPFYEIVRERLLFQLFEGDPEAQLSESSTVRRCSPRGSSHNSQPGINQTTAGSVDLGQGSECQTQYRLMLTGRAGAISSNQQPLNPESHHLTVQAIANDLVTSHITLPIESDGSFSGHDSALSVGDSTSQLRLIIRVHGEAVHAENIAFHMGTLVETILD